MKKVLLGIVVLFIETTFDPARGKNIDESGYNPNPYFTTPYDVFPQIPTQTDQDFSNIFGKIPPRWSENQVDNLGTLENKAQNPRTMSEPYYEIRPYTSGELTNPYLGVIPQSPNKATGFQSRELTPPAPQGKE
ncbi:MAG: hypothetical protein ABSE95_06555 [Thermodesulfobacteriota bacterium]